MRVRLLFYCPHCDSLLFRSSQSRPIRDSFLRPFGVHPQRCEMCRLRFYLFKPNRLRALLFLLGRGFKRPRPSGLQDVAESDTRPLKAWDLPPQNASHSAGRNGKRSSLAALLSRRT
jgi:hypothetical protein